MAYEEFDGELDKPGEDAKGGFVEFDGELDAPAEGKKDEPKAEPRTKRGTMRQVTPFVGGDQKQGPGGAGRGVVNPPMVNEGRRPGESVLDMAGRPPPSDTAPSGPLTDRDMQVMAAESISPREQERRARDFKYMQGTGTVQASPLEHVIGDTMRQGLEGTIGKGGAAIVGGVVGGVAELGKTIPGAVAAGADLVGAEGVSEFAQGAVRRGSGMQQAVMPQGEGIDKKVAEVFSSIAATAPTMVLGVAGQGAALKLMFGQTALANYGELRSQGFQPVPSAAASVIHGGAEVLGERFGFKEQTIAVKGLMDRMMRHGSSTDDMAKNAAKLMLKEIPGEELTTTIQFLNDKYGFAPRSPEATLTDYFKQLAETAITTMGQSGVVGGTPALIDKTSKTYKQADEAWKLSAGTLPKGPYRDAAEKGFVVDPPLVTDPPATQRAKTVKIFENVAAESGVSSAAIKRAKEAADGMPAADVGPFLNDVLQVLQRKGGVATPIAEHASAALTAGAAVPLSPEEAAAAKESLKPAAEQEEDLTGLADATPASALEDAAHAAAPSPKNERPEPTPAQAEAGNYAKGHFKIDGLDVSIENPEGSVRKDMKNVPPKWENQMKAHYGYIRGTVGQDGDHIDTFIKPGTKGEHGGEVFVVDQLHADGTPDEHKVMVGYANEQEARDAYLSHYPKGWKGLGAITAAPIDQFKAWLKEGDTKQPFAPKTNEPAQPDVQPAPIVAPEPAAGGGDQPGGSVGAVGQPAADTTRPAPRGAPAAPASSVRAPGAVGNRGDKPAPVGRVISKVGVTPATAEPLELRDNPDGTTSPWHDGYPVVDFESGDPLVIPAGTSDADALKIVKGARPFGRNSKYFAVASEEAPAAEPAPAPAPAPTPEPEKINTPPAEAPALSPLTQARNTLIDLRTKLEAQGQVVDARLEGRIKRQEKLIKEMEAEEAAPAAPAPASRETIEPEKDTAVGKNAQGEALYERGDGSRYRMHNGRPDFGGDLVPAERREAPVSAAEVDKPAAAEGEIAQPDTLAEALTALERGDRIVRFPGSEFEERVWITESKAKGGASNSWVVKSKSADSPVTITKGPVGPDRKWGWGKGDAARKATEGWTFEAEDAPKAQPAPSTKEVEKPEVGTLAVVSADERLAAGSDNWETTEGDPTEAEIKAASDAVKPGMYVQTKYGYMAPQQVVNVVHEKGEWDDAASTQIQTKNLHRPRKNAPLSSHGVFLRDGKLYEDTPETDDIDDANGYQRVYVLDKALPSENPQDFVQGKRATAAPATLPDEKAFADDYAAFEGKTVEQPVQVEETGETLKMRMDAATALRELDKRRKALEALKACLEKA